MTPRARALGRETERAYWRRRANRHVRKRRRLQLIVRGMGSLTLHALVLGLIVISGRGLLQQVREGGEFALRRIEIHGANPPLAAALRQRLAGCLGRNIWSLDLRALRRAVEAEVWVHRCTLRRRLPDTLELEVEVRRPRAVAVLEQGPRVVDEEGVIVAPAGAARGLARITGLSRLPPRARDEALRRGLRALAALEGLTGWPGPIEALDVGYTDRLVLRLGEGDPPLLLDPQRPERNVRDYLALRAEINERVGPSEYVDLRWQGRIAVMPWKEVAEPKHVAEGR